MTAAGMILRHSLAIALAASLAACGDSGRKSAKRDSHRPAQARSGAKDFGHKTEHAFRHVGGHLEKFFTGHDTISR